jgi:hypothetical protein
MDTAWARSPLTPRCIQPESAAPDKPFNPPGEKTNRVVRGICVPTPAPPISLTLRMAGAILSAFASPATAIVALPRAERTMCMPSNRRPWRSVAGLVCLLVQMGRCADSAGRYGGLGLGEDLRAQIPARHILAFRIDLTNTAPFVMRGYLKDWYRLTLADTAAESSAVTTNKAAGSIGLSVSGAGSAAKAFYTIGYNRQYANRGTFRLYGGERIAVERSALSPADGKLRMWIQLDNGFTVAFPTPASAEMQGRVVDVLDIPEDLNGNLHRLWFELESKTDEPVEVGFRRLMITRPSKNTRIDAGTILAERPAHAVVIRPLNGVPAIVCDGAPVNGCGYSRLLNYEIRDETLEEVYAADGLKGGTYRIVTVLGEDPWNVLNPPTWNGPDFFDFSYPDREAMRMHRIDPEARFFFCLAVDGARWWNYLHPDDAGEAFEMGLADYLSDRWRADMEDALEQFVAFLSTRPYYTNILGLMLWNGSSMDCNPEVNIATPAAIGRFRTFLRQRYTNEGALQTAWNDATVTFATATPRPDVMAVPADQTTACPLLVDPATGGAYRDTIRFMEQVWQTIVIDFCKAVKRVSGGDLLAGARTGDFMGHMWGVGDGSDGPRDTNPLAMLLECPEMDFFEVQEPYLGRYLGYHGGSGTPVLPIQSVFRRNKAVLYQNDTPLHTGTMRNDDLSFLVGHVRRCYVNGIVNGVYPYQLGVGWTRLARPELMEQYGAFNTLMTRAQQADRSSVAEVAFVFDLDYQKYIGFDPQYDKPSRSIPLFDHIKWSWARAGVPYDMILLQDLDAARDYKVYVFVHCFALSPDERALIEKHALREGKTAVFTWADGYLSDGRADSGVLSELTGLDIRSETSERNWLLKPTAALSRTHPPHDAFPMSTFDFAPQDIALPADVAYGPSFYVADPEAETLAVYAEGGAVAVARKEKNGCAVYYSAPAILPPNLLRYIVERAGCHSYVDTEDACYVNASMVGLHAGRSGTVCITLPSPSPLTDVLTGAARPSARRHEISVAEHETYLFFRGTREAWDQR